MLKKLVITSALALFVAGSAVAGENCSKDKAACADKEKAKACAKSACDKEKAAACSKDKAACSKQTAQKQLVLSPKLASLLKK